MNITNYPEYIDKVPYGLKITFETDVSGKSVKLDYEIPNSNEKEWLGVIDDNLRPDKQQWILDEWYKDFPNRTVKDFDFISKMASRSELVKNWLSQKTDQFSIDVRVPSYFKDYVDPYDWQKAQTVSSKISAAYKRRQEALDKINNEYKKEVAKIMNDRVNYKDIDALTSDPLVYIANLGQVKLPLTIVMAMTKFNPARNSQPTAQAYARECLIKYKISLIKAYYENDLDINGLIDLVESNMVK